VSTIRYYSLSTDNGVTRFILAATQLVLFGVALLLIVLGYAMYSGRARDITPWGVMGKLSSEEQRERYGREQGRFAMLTGLLFFLVPVSVFVVDRTGVDPRILYSWLVLFGILVAIHGIRIRRVLQQ
jgi:hypothetical protein